LLYPRNLPTKPRSRSVQVVDCGERLLAPAMELEAHRHSMLVFETAPADLVSAEALLYICAGAADLKGNSICWCGPAREHRAAQRPAQYLRTMLFGRCLMKPFHRRQKATLWYYRTHLEIHPSPVVEELDLVASEIEDVAASEALNRLAHKLSLGAQPIGRRVRKT